MTSTPIPWYPPENPKQLEGDRFFFQTLRGDYPQVETVTSEDYLFVSRYRDNMFKDHKIITVTDFQTFLSSGSVPNSRTLTINGQTFDLTANREWTISIIESDPVFTAWLGTVAPSNWNTAYGWGNHASAGYLTSVTAHDLLSATHGDTTAGTVARGDIITGQGGTAKWARLTKGTADQVLAMDGTGTDIIWKTPSSDEKVKLNASDPTAGYLDDKITGYGFLPNGYNTAPVYFGIGKGATTFGFLVGETGQTAVQSAVIATDAGKASTISVQGAGQAYFMGRDITNDIEFVMGTSTLGGAFAGSMTNHPFWLRTNNSTHWTVGTTGNFMAGTDGTGNKNITTAGQIKGGTGLIGSTANFTDFANAKLVISKDNTGSVSAAVASAVGEATSDGTNPGVGFLGFGASSAAGSGIGVYGVGRPTSATDEASVYGFYGQAIYAHTGGLNIGGRFDAEAGTYGNIGVYGIAKAPTTALQSNTTKAVYGYAKTGGGASYANHAIGGYFRGFVADTNDTGYCYGIQAIATDTHAGGRNYAIYASASGGTANYSFFSDVGTMYQTGTAQFQGLLGIREGGSTPTYYTYFQGGDQTASITYTLPTALPGSNKFLQCTSAGVWSWETAGGGSPGGADTQIQFNDGGAFGGDSKFVFNKTSGLVTTSIADIRATVVDGYYIKNSTAATNGVSSQNSPALHFEGSAWRGSTSSSVTIGLKHYLACSGAYSNVEPVLYWELDAGSGFAKIIRFGVESNSTTYKVRSYFSASKYFSYNLDSGFYEFNNGSDIIYNQLSTNKTSYWQQFARNTANAGTFMVYSCDGDPNGQGVQGTKGSTCHDTTNGKLWIKSTDDSVDTGWLEAGSSTPIFDSFTGTAIIDETGNYVTL